MIPSLSELCLTRLLELRYEDDASILVVRELLDDHHFGVKAVSRAALRTPEALAGLRHLNAPTDPEWTLVDACRRSLATTTAAASLVQSAERTLRDRIDAHAVSSETCDEVALTCRALLGNDRFKRDMEGPVLPKPVADRVRALRNLAAAHGHHGAKPAVSASPHWRYQDLRHAGSRPRRGLPASRGPWFPGYDH